MPPGGPQVRRELRPPLAAGRVPGREGDRGPRDLTIASRRGIDLAVPDTEAATGTDWEAMPLSLAAAAGAHPPAGCRGDGGGDGDGGGGRRRELLKCSAVVKRPRPLLRCNGEGGGGGGGGGGCVLDEEAVRVVV